MKIKPMRAAAALIAAGLLMVCRPSLASQDSLTLSFIGDVSIGDAYRYREAASGFHETVRQKGIDWPFSTVAETLRADDLTLANLEGTITPRKRHRDVRMPLYIHPDHTQILLSGGVDAVNTANNHALDFYEEGYRDTLGALDEAGIVHFGSIGRGIDRQAVVSVKGVKIGLIGLSYPQESDLKRLEEKTRALRGEGCSLIVLSLHWGRETHMQPDAAQYRFAAGALALDVDVIWGHHPHVVQPVALYQGKPVLFSTGNFIFGTMKRVDPSTGIFQLVYDLEEDGPKLSALRVMPCLTGEKGDWRPVPLEEEAARREVFAKLQLRRPEMGFEPLAGSFLEGGEVRFD